MESKEKVIIYPFDLEIVPVLKNTEFLSRYEIVGLVSPKGWGLTNKDGGVVNGEKLGIEVTDDFSGLLEKCDTVIFNHPQIRVSFDKLMKSKLEETIEKEKNIISLTPIDEELLLSLTQQCKARNLYIKPYGNIQNNINYHFEEGIEYIHAINAPVIFVMGMGERTGKFEIQLSLREQLIMKGYKLSQVGTRSYCEMFGFHSMPAFMYDDYLSADKKILLFNHFVKSIETKENPDLIVIGVPVGLYPLSNYFTNKFGAAAYQISQALKPDAVILSTYYDDYTPAFFEEILTGVKYRFGSHIDCYNLAHFKLDWESSRQDRRLTYITIDSQMVEQKKKEFSALDRPVYNCSSPNDIKEMAEYLIEKLSDYANVTLM